MKIEISHLCEIMMLNLFLKPPSIIQKKKKTIKIFVKALKRNCKGKGNSEDFSFEKYSFKQFE